MALAIDGTAVAPGVNGTSASLTLTTSNANDVIVVAAAPNNAAVSSISGGGLTWTKRAAGDINGGGSSDIETWYAIASAALSSATITVNFSASVSFASLIAFGISGANTSSPFDSHAGLPAVISSGSGDVTISTSNANDFVFAVYRFGGTSSPTAGSGFTGITAAGAWMLVEYKIVSAAQSGLDFTIGTGTGNTNGGIGDAIVAAAAAPVVIARRRNMIRLRL